MFAFKPHKGAIFQLAFAPDGRSIATCGRAPFLCVSDAATGVARLRWTGGSQVALGLAYSPDGALLATPGWATVSVIDATTGAELGSFLGGGYGITFTPDGSGVVTGCTLRESGAIRTALRTVASAPFTASEPLAALAGILAFNRFRYSPDGRFLAALAATAGTDALGMILLDAATGALVARARVGNLTYGVGGLAFHPSAPVLVYSGGPRLVAYSLETHAPVAERVQSKKYIQDAAFTPDGKHLVTVSNDTMAVLWETSGWSAVREFAWDIGPLKSVAVSPDGTRAACASDRGRVVVWDLDL
jgi:WD40 repeat protein